MAVLRTLLVLIGTLFVSVSCDDSHVRQLSAIDWSTTIGKDTAGMWVVLVTAPPTTCGEPCAKAQETVEKVAAKTQGLVNFGKADVRDTLFDDEANESQVGAVFNITQVPTLLVYQFGPKFVTTAMRMEGQVAGYVLQTPKALFQQMKAIVPSLVKRVSQYNVDQFLTEDNGASPQAPRLLLFPSKKQTSLLYRKLSLVLHGHVVVGEALVADDVLAAKFGIESRPALLLSGRGPFDADAPDEDLQAWTHYDGDFRYEAIHDWVRAAHPPASVTFLDSQDMFERMCVEKGGVCFLGVLPSRSDAEQSHEAFEELSRQVFISVTYGGSTPAASAYPLQFSWVRGDQQPALIAAFEKLQSPGVIAINAKKKAYAVYVGSLHPHDLLTFAHRVLTGAEALSTVDALPRIATPPTPPPSSKKAKKGKKKSKKKGKKKKSKKDKPAKTEL